MVKKTIIIISYIFISIIILIVALLVLSPTEQSLNAFVPSPFPDLKRVSTTTLIIDEPIGEYVGTGFHDYTRDKFEGELIVEDQEVKNYSALLSKRGATSFEFNKHQFSVSFVNIDKVQVKRKLLDMPKGEDWVLNGPLLDRSMMRNYIAYKTAFDIMGYAPRTQFTEFYIQVEDQEPEYMGLYLWIEKIRQDDNRVNINPTAMNLNETSYIIAKDEYRADNQLFNVYGKELYMYGYQYVDVYPRVTLSDEQKNYIGDTVTSFERTLYHDKYDIPRKGYAEFINVDNFIDYYIINEFFMNTDAGNKSTYIHKDVRGPIHIGPVWDFNNAMGNINTLFPKDSYEGLFMHDRMWYDKLLQDPVFTSRLIARYEALRQGPLDTDTLLASIDEATKVIKPYADKDHDLYTDDIAKEAMFNFIANENQELIDHFNSLDPAVSDFDDEVTKLKNFIVNRSNWLDKNIHSIRKWTD